MSFSIVRKPMRLPFAFTTMLFWGANFGAAFLGGSDHQVVAQEKTPDSQWESISDTAIDKPLAPFNADRAGEVTKQAVAIDKRLRQICQAFENALAKEARPTINPKDVGVANAAVWRTERICNVLAGLGEPASVDFKLRCADYRKTILKAATACAEQSTFPSSDVMYKQLEALETQRKKILEQVKPLISNGDFDLADQQVTKLLDLYGQMEPWVVIGRVTDTMYHPDPLLNARNEIDVGRESSANKFYREKLVDDAKAILPDADDLPNALRGAANQLVAGKETQFYEQNLSGPDIVRKSAQKWREYEEAYRQAFAMRKMASILSVSDPSKNEELNTSIQLAEAARAKMAPLVAEALAMLIEKDGKDAEAAEVPALHQAYVEALGELDARSPLKDFRAQIEAGFATMLDKDPEYKAQVAAYRDATTWMLGWRRRTTLARVKERHIASHSPLSVQVKNVFAETAATRLFEPNGPSHRMGAQHMRRIVELATPMLIGSSVAHGPFAATIPVGGTTKTDAETPAPAKNIDLNWYSIPQARVVVEGSGITPDLWQPELKSLESDLLVDGGAKAMTIEAASALASARQGIFRHVGAAVDSFSFEPVLTYLHRHGWQPGVTTFFGNGYREFGEVDSISIVLRIRLTEPDWLANEYFFADLDADPTPVAVASPK
jgi:hypothetical protein